MAERNPLIGRLMALASLLPLSAQAQTPFAFTDPNTGAAASTGSAISLSQMQAQGARKQDVDSLVRYLSAGQTEAQLLAGTIDASPSISAGIAAGRVVLPCGMYTLNEPLSVPSGLFDLVGVANECVTFNVTFPTGDIVTLTGLQRPRLSGVTINATAQRTSGAAVHLVSTYGAKIDDIAFTGPHAADAIEDDGGRTTYIDHIDCRPPIATVGVGFYGAGACIHGTGNFTGLYANHINSLSWEYGLELTNGSGAVISAAELFESNQGVTFDPPTGAMVSAIHLTDVQSDTSALDNFYFGGAGYITDIQTDNIRSSSSQLGNGINFNNPLINGVQMNGSNVLYNWEHGVLIAQGKGITFTGLTAQANSKFGSGVYNGVAIAGTTAVDNITIEAGREGAGGIDVARGNASLQAYGIAVVPLSGGTETRHLTFMGNQAIGNVTGGYNLTSGSTVVNLGNQ